MERDFLCQYFFSWFIELLSTAFLTIVYVYLLLFSFKKLKDSWQIEDQCVLKWILVRDVPSNVSFGYWSCMGRMNHKKWTGLHVFIKAWPWQIYWARWTVDLSRYDIYYVQHACRYFEFVDFSCLLSHVIFLGLKYWKHYLNEVWKQK